MAISLIRDRDWLSSRARYAPRTDVLPVIVESTIVATPLPTWTPPPRNVFWLPTIVDPWTVAWIVLGALTIAVLASVLPALRAALLRPVEALRYE